MKPNYILLNVLISIFAVPILLLGCQKTKRHTEYFPDSAWLQYADLSDAGWDETQLENAVKFADSLNTAAFMLIEDGIIVKSYGDISRRFACHSVRKSLLSALYGIYVERGLIDTSKTIQELGIDDIGKLTEAEKQAKIVHLLKSRSGIFHPAAYETPFMASTRPAREAYSPDTYWYYNNWDFNTLGYIFNLETGEDLFNAFEKQIAQPIKMQDFEAHHGYYHLEPGHSQFPAYPFRLSARDMARFGLLFQRQGSWNGKQIISKDWIEKSIAPYSTELGSYSGSGYGFMWWLLEKEFDEFGGGYSALGVGEQTITVLPELNIVFVHRTNTYQNNNISRNSTIKLLKSLLRAKVGNSDSTPRLEQYKELENQQEDYKDYRKFVSLKGQYEYSSGISFEIVETKNDLRLIDERMGHYNLLFTSDSSFLLEDRLEQFYTTSINGKPMLISERIVNREGYHLLNSNRIEEALEMLRLNTVYYPESYNVFDSMGEALLIAGDTLSAVENYKRSIVLNPNNSRAIWLMMELNIDGFERQSLSSADIARYTGDYSIRNQSLRLQAKGNKLNIILQNGRGEIELVPFAQDKFIVSRGNHDIFDFSIGDNGDGFNIITQNGIVGKWVRQ